MAVEPCGLGSLCRGIYSSSFTAVISVDSQMSSLYSVVLLLCSMTQVPSCYKVDAVLNLEGRIHFTKNPAASEDVQQNTRLPFVYLQRNLGQSQDGRVKLGTLDLAEHKSKTKDSDLLTRNYIKLDSAKSL